MKEAVEEAVEENNGSKNIGVSLDGTWQKRGFSSMNCVVSAKSIESGFMLWIH